MPDDSNGHTHLARKVESLFDPKPRTTTARNAVEAGMAQTECIAALDEFNRDLASFCKRLSIPPSWLTLRTPELLMLVCMRQQGIIDTLRSDLDELARLKGTSP